MKWINNYFKNNHNLEDFNLNNSKYLESIKNYYQYTKSDPTHHYYCMKKYLKKCWKFLIIIANKLRL